MSAAPSTCGGSHFDVLLLGPFAIYRDGIPVDASAWQRKVQTLLRILATSPDKRRSRDELVEMLWPEAAPDAGPRNLRVVLHMLRRGLGPCDPPAIVSESGWIALGSSHEWDIDLDRFEELAGTGSDEIVLLEEAAGYIRGEPLTEDRYEDWALGVRARVQRVWRELCLRLARLHRRAGAPEIAVSWLDRLMESDALDEEALRYLLVALGELGRGAEALRRYQTFAQHLKAELDLAPSHETLAVVAELRTGRESAPPVSPAVEAGVAGKPLPVIPRSLPAAQGTLVGRQRELGKILWTLPPMHTVAPRLVAVSGESGMGKTRLLAEAAARARRAEVLTLAGSCYRHEGSIPYGPIRDALAEYVEIQPERLVRTQLEGLLGILCPIVPEIRLRFPEVRETGEADGNPLLLYLAVGRALERIGQSMPLMLLLDDLQWSDEGTRRMLHFLVRQMSQNAVLIVGGYCCSPDEGISPIAEMAADMEQAGWSTCLTLGPLDAAALVPLIEERIRGHCAPDLIAALLSESGGNPLIALQVLRRWQDIGRLRHVGGVWQLIAPAVVEPAFPKQTNVVGA